MGKRGNLARLTLIQPEALDDLTPPDWLGEIGKDFWHKHAASLAENNMLTSTTTDTFALLCDLWQNVRTSEGRLRLDTVSRFYAVAKLFKLIPQQAGKPAERFDDKDFFDI